MWKTISDAIEAIFKPHCPLCVGTGFIVRKDGAIKACLACGKTGKRSEYQKRTRED